MNKESGREQVSPARPSKGWDVLWIVSIALIYFAMARLSLLFVFQPEGIAAIWPPSGIFLSAILLTRRNLRPYLVAVLLVTDFIAEMAAGTPFMVSAVYALVLAGDAALSFWLLLRFVGEPIAFRRIRDVFGLLFFAIVLSNGLLALVAASASTMLPGTSFWVSWKWWAASDAIGNLLVTPFILSWASFSQARLKFWNLKRAAEGIALFVPLVLVNYIAFSRLSEHGPIVLLYTYLTFPFLLWAALRFGLRSVSTALVILAVIAIRSTIGGGVGSPSGNVQLDAVIIVQLYLAVIAIPSLFLAAAVAERQIHEREIERLNRLYTALSQVNQAVVHVHLPEEFKRDVCRVLVEFGGFKTAWIGRMNQDTGQLAIIAKAGDEWDFLNDTHLSAGNGPGGREPTGKAIREAKLCVCNDFDDNQRSIPPWSQAVIRAGFRASAALPLRRAGQVTGALTVYARETGFFGEKELALLEEVASDIGFALEHLDNEARRKQAELELRQSETRYRLIFALNPLPMWVYEAKTLRFLEVNEAAVKNYGYTEKEFRAMTLRDIRPPEDVPALEALIPRIPHGLANTGEWRHLKKDGTVILVAIHSHDIDLQGHNARLVLAEDITERKRAEETLRERNRYIETVLENAPIGFAVNTIHDGKGLFVGSKFEEIYGVARSSITSVDEYFEKVYLDPAFREEIRARMLADMSSGDAARMRWDDLPITTAAGEKKFVTAINIPLLDQNLMVSTVQDVTARHLAEEARQESQQRFQTLAAATFEGIALTEKGVLVDLNDQLAEMTGYQRDALIGQPVWMVVAPESRELVEASIREARQEPYEHLARRRDGSRFPVEVRARCVQIGDRTLRISSIRDISPHRRLEDDLRAMLDEKTTLLKEVHHRVKNNLQIITSLLNLQADRIKDPKVLDLLQDTRQRIRSMALLHETLYGSTNVARINFATYVENLCAHVFRSYSSSSSRVRFRCHVSDVELGLDQAIPCGLIVNELVSNALKHAFPDDRAGEISVEMNATPDFDVTLHVADTGVGLPPGYESRRGQTLGLQLVTILTAQLKGTLQVLRDGGTVFRITFRAKSN